MTQFEKVEVRTRCPNGCKYKSGYTCVASECPYQTGGVRYDIRLNAEDRSTKINTQVKQAVKEFAEKVKGKSEMFLDEKEYVSIEKIDELLKEF